VPTARRLAAPLVRLTCQRWLLKYERIDGLAREVPRSSESPSEKRNARIEAAECRMDAWKKFANRSTSTLEYSDRTIGSLRNSRTLSQGLPYRFWQHNSRDCAIFSSLPRLDGAFFSICRVSALSLRSAHHDSFNSYFADRKYRRVLESSTRYVAWEN